MMSKSDKKDKKNKKEKLDKKDRSENKDEIEKKTKSEKERKAGKKDKNKEKKDKKGTKDREDKKDKKEKKDKKKKSKDSDKKRKRKDRESDSDEEFVIHEKKVKNDTKPHTESKTSDTANNENNNVTTTGWNDWNKASFGGDAAKKDKFLRLLGAKKGNSSMSKASTTTASNFVPASKPKSGGLYGSLKSAIDEDEQQRISQDLEKQFDHGLQFRKQMQMGRRGGLGFN